MKKRSCRRTVDQDKIHDKAVKLRKMTDEQLVHYVEDRVEKARSEGKNEAKGGNDKVQEFVDLLMNTKIKGIGAATASKIMSVAIENGYIQ